MKTSPSKKRTTENHALYQNKDFDSLLSRLELAKKQQAPNELKQLMSPNEISSLLTFFDKTQTYNQTRSRSNALKGKTELSRLKPGEAYRLHKKITKLPRTMTVLRHPEGEYAVIAETKSKVANGKKRKLEKEAGSFKSGKPCWRLDGYTEYFNLVTKLNDEEAFDRLKEEVGTSQALASEYVNETQIGPVYTKNNTSKASVYSVRAIGTLMKLIKSNNLNDEQINSLTKQLLLGLKYIHERYYIHQDLKPDNILVYGDAKQGYHLKYTDFGNCSSPMGDDIESLSTWDYASPEIICFYSDQNTSHYEFYRECKAKSSAYGDLFKPPSIPARWGKPHETNDIWAAGIIIFEMRYGRKPRANDKAIINQDPLLSKMLAPLRKDRIGIDEALNIFNNLNNDENPGPQQKRRKLAK